MHCIFCKIIAGDLPCAKIMETDSILGFLDIAPVEPGHVLIIPKTHVESFLDLPDRLLEPLAAAARSVARQLKAKLGADGISLSQANGASAGQVVPHVHIHVIPRHAHTPMHFRNGRYESPEAMQAMAETLSLL